MTQNPDEIREEIERTRSELSQDVDALSEKVSPSKVAHRQTEKVRDTVTGWKDKVMGTANDATSRVSEGAEHLAAHEWGRETSLMPLPSPTHVIEPVDGVTRTFWSEGSGAITEASSVLQDSDGELGQLLFGAVLSPMLSLEGRSGISSAELLNAAGAARVG